MIFLNFFNRSLIVGIVQSYLEIRYRLRFRKLIFIRQSDFWKWWNMGYPRYIRFNKQWRLFFLLYIRFFLVHRLFFVLRFYCNFKCLSCKLFFIAYTHILSRWTRTLSEFITIITFKTQTNPRELNPNPSFIIIIRRNSFNLFIIIFKLL